MEKRTIPTSVAVFKLEAIKKLITPLFYLCVIVFFAYYFRNIDFDKLKGIQVDYTNLVIGVTVLVLARFWLSFTWGQILKMLGVKDFKFIDLNYVYAKAWLGRYIPGKVVWVLGKIHFASEYGISKIQTGISALLEVGIQICVTLLLGFGLVFMTGSGILEPNIQKLMGVIILIILILLFPPVFNKLTILALNLLKKIEIESTGYDYGVLLRIGGYFFVFGLISGIAFFFIICSFYDLAFDLASYVIGVQNLSGAMSILAIFAPTGIGVREGVQLVLLRPILTDEILMIVLVVGRLAGMFADFLFYGISLRLVKRR